MIQAPEKVVKNLLEVIDDVGYYLHGKAHNEYDYDEDACELLNRLREAKHEFENHAKESSTVEKIQ